MPSITEQLLSEFEEAASSIKIGGATILNRLGALASGCIIGKSASQDAVAFAISTIFLQYAEEWDGSYPITGDDTYRLMALGGECLREAIKFVDAGGHPDTAVEIISSLARITPDRLYERWPPNVG